MIVRTTSTRAATVAMAVLTCASTWAVARPAAAWDPSTTHAGMTSRALTDSAVHLRWMEASELSRGLFTSLRIDPARLDPDLLRRIELAQRRAHADSGARGLGGPGACPGVSAPASTRTKCVDGDVWESTAMGWVALGVIAEVTPRERILHHFVDLSDPSASTWTAKKVPRAALRAAQRRGGGPGTATLTGTAFRGGAASAVGWLDDPDDPWAPPAMFEHFRKASLLADPVARQHHLALGLIGMGALLHVVQDAAVPAHARGDVLAFLAPLSTTPGDRGLPLAEFARVMHGRTGLPTRLSLDPRDDAAVRGTTVATTLVDHIVAASGAAFEGVAVTASSRFLSEGTLPEPQVLDPDLDGVAAAEVLLAGSGLADNELQGARLSPWPSSTGYVLSAKGRPLAAFSTDATAQTSVVLDRRVYRDQIGHLVPMAIDASRSIVDLVFPAWPTTIHHPGGDVLEVDATALPGVDPKLSILIEAPDGQRRVHRVVPLKAGARSRIVGAVPGLSEGERVVLVVRSTVGTHRLTTESRLLSGVDKPDAAEADKALAPVQRPPAAESPEPKADDAEGVQGDAPTDADADETPTTPAVPESAAPGSTPGAPTTPTSSAPVRSPGTVATPDAP